MSSNTKNAHLELYIVLKRIQIGIIFKEGFKLVGKRKKKTQFKKSGKFKKIMGKKREK